MYRSLRDILGGVEFFGFILCLFPKKILVYGFVYWVYGFDV